LNLELVDRCTFSVGHVRRTRILVDRGVLDFDRIRAATGHSCRIRLFDG